MVANMRTWRSLSIAMAIALLTCSVLSAQEGRRRARIGTYDANAQTVEMFAAIEKGDIAVKLIPKDSTECRVMIENKTDKPLNVKLPNAFAGVPVLAQQLGGAGGRSSGSNRSTGTGGGNQGMGGGMGGMGMGGMGMGMGMFNVPPERVGQFKVATMCLEHGKAEPRAAVPYEIKPIESFTTKPGVRELCEMLGSGNVNQRAAQAAAWHLNNDMTWEQLAAKRLRHANGTSEPYFSAQEIQAAMQLSATAERTAKERQATEKPSTTKSTVTSEVSR